MVRTGPRVGDAPHEGAMARPTKLTGRAALSAIAYILSTAGVGGGLAGCVVPGTSTLAVKPVPVAPPPSSEVAQPVTTETPEQNIRPGQDVATDAPRRD